MLPCFQLDDVERALAIGTPMSGVSSLGSAALWLDPHEAHIAVAASDRACGKRGHGPLGTVLGKVRSRFIVRDGTSQRGRAQLLTAVDQPQHRYPLAQLLARHHELRTLLRCVLTRLAQRHGHVVVHHVVQAGAEADDLGPWLRALAPQVIVVEHTVDLEGLDAAARRKLRTGLGRTLAHTLAGTDVEIPTERAGYVSDPSRPNATLHRIDAELHEVAATLDVEALVTPTNLSAVGRAFLADSGRAPLAFEYLPLNVDAHALRARLCALPIHDLPAGALASQLDARRCELVEELELLERRGTPHFVDRARELYGAPDSALVTTALEILVATEGYNSPPGTSQRLGGKALRARLAELSAVLGLPEPPTLRVGTVLDRAYVTGEVRLLLPRQQRATPQAVIALAVGEIGGRLIPRFNAARQPLRLAASGFAGARRTEEGRVVALEYLHGVLAPERLRELAARVVTVADLLSDEPFARVFQRLRHEYGFATRDAWRICARAYRGGGWVAEALSLAGFLDLLRHRETGGTLADVMGGNWPLTALGDVNTLRATGWLVDPAILPPARLPAASLPPPAATLPGTPPESTIAALPQPLHDIVTTAM